MPEIKSKIIKPQGNLKQDFNKIQQHYKGVNHGDSSACILNLSSLSCNSLCELVKFFTEESDSPSPKHLKKRSSKSDSIDDEGI